MKKSLSLTAFILVFTIVLAACGVNSGSNNGTSGAGGATNTPSTEPAATPTDETAPSEIVVKHSLGEDTVKVNPSNVVVFDFGVLDTLDKLGVDVKGVAQSSVPAYLEKYAGAEYTNIGSLKEPDLETIHGMKPELIIISGRQQDYYDELKKIAPTIFMGADNSRFMESFEENMRLLGQIFDKEEQVETELAVFGDQIAALKERAEASGKNGLIILANDGNISAYGPGSRFGIIHDVFGVAPVDADIKVSTHGDEISFEYIVDKNPGYLFVVDRNAAVGGEGNAKDSIENDLVKKTTTYQEGNIVYLDPQYWYLSGGGLVSFGQMLNDIDAAIK